MGDGASSDQLHPTGSGPGIDDPATHLLIHRPQTEYRSPDLSYRPLHLHVRIKRIGCILQVVSVGPLIAAISSILKILRKVALKLMSLKSNTPFAAHGTR